MKFVLVYYAGLVLVLSGWLFTQRWRWITGIPVLSVALGMTWGASESKPKGIGEITVLTYPGGHALYGESSQEPRRLLIDCGPDEVAEWLVKPFLRARSVKDLSALLLTHSAVAQVGGASYIDTHFHPTAVLVNPVPGRSAPYRKVLEEATNASTAVTAVTRGDQFGVYTVLHPEAGDAYARADDAALVLRARIGDTRVLMLSDLGRQGQDALLSRHHPNDLRADIILTGLPKAGEPLAEPLLAAIAPKLIVVADSIFPATSLAGPRLRERLAAHGVPVVYCHDQGSVHLYFTGHGWVLRSIKGLELRSDEPR